mgnify:CR=1 FL=1
MPFEACIKPLENLPTLVGLRVEKGVIKQVAERLGRESGCAHLVELAVNAVRVAGAVPVAEGTGVTRQKFARLREEERLRLGRPHLGDTCYVYSEKRLREVLS